MQELGAVGDAALKLVFAAMLSGLVGLERERKGRAAGLRTHVLVSLGATLAMVVSDTLADEWNASGATVWLDKGRIAAGILTGIGFLGAGTIINVGGTHRGLTTAAMIWFVAVQGIAIGAGLYAIAAAATGMALLMVVGLEWVEDHLPSSGVYFLTVELPNGLARVPEVEDIIRREGYIAHLHRLKLSEGESRAELVFEVSRVRPHIERLVIALREAYPAARRIEARK